MRIRPITIAAATVLAVAGSAAAKSPDSLILKQGAFPAHTDYDGSPGSEGWDLRTALGDKGLDDVPVGGYYGTYLKKDHQIQIRGAVIAASSAAQATKAYTIVVDARKAFWKMFNQKVNPLPSGVPSYGQKQVAFVNLGDRLAVNSWVDVV